MAPDQHPIPIDPPATVIRTTRRDDRLSTGETALLVSALLTLAGVIVFIGLS